MPGLVDDLAFVSAEETAALVRTGGASPREVVEAALRRIEALDPALNAFIEVDGERGFGSRRRRRARRPRARSRACRSRSRATSASRATRSTAARSSSPATGPDHSAYLVRRLREAGFVIVGITNLPEFAILPTTEPRHTGPTRNPWDLDAHARRVERRQRGGGRRPGCSRSRTATTAAGRSASPPPRCGLVGLKPSRGRVSSRARTSASPGWPPTACSPAPWPTRRSRSTCSAATRSATRTGRRARSSPT